MWHFTYLFSVMVFCGLPFIIMWEKKKRLLKRYELLVLLLVAIGTVLAASDYFAVKWGAWYYIPSRNLGIHFITQIETFAFSAAIFLTMSVATIISATMVDARNKKRRHLAKRSNRTLDRARPKRRVTAPART